MTMLHRYRHGVTEADLPLKFTYPFCYTPHPLVAEAAQEVMDYVGQLSEGKMMGVLTVRDDVGEVGYLAAYSGEFDDSEGYFVEPVVDYLRPDGYFKVHEEDISAINRKITELENSVVLRDVRQRLADVMSSATSEKEAMREAMRLSKAQRAARRSQGNVTPEEEAAMIRQSQYEKAEMKRLERRLKDEQELAERELELLTREIDLLKAERKSRSAELQKWLFDQYDMADANGERRTLNSIFGETKERIPPSGAGDCCAPRLLQYAYLHGMTPVAMGEFWVGPSPVSTMRHHGSFYPSCLRKCRPILKHMLRGLVVDDNPLERNAAEGLPVVYEDEWIVVVDKPSGLQSVPGLLNVDSVVSRLQDMYGGGYVAVAHRLDQDTSGLLIAAKDKEVLSKLQMQFERREVKKRYEAILERRPQRDSGVINLPIGQDPDDSCRRIVDKVNGRTASTRYRVMDVAEDGRCRVEFFPETGRTHQLRIHSAHKEGLDAPIAGDPLYGHRDQRLYLHAAGIQFIHPVTGDVVSLVSKAF